MAANFYAYTVSGAFGGLAMTGASLIIIRTGIFARWTGWDGLVTGIAAIISGATLIQNDPAGLFATINGIAWLIYFLWIVVLSVAAGTLLNYMEGLQTDRYQEARKAIKGSWKCFVKNCCSSIFTTPWISRTN